MMSKFTDLTGQTFGRLRVLRRAVDTKGTKFLCQCECGSEVEVARGNLKSGHTQSCGCLRVDAAKKSFTTHGEKINSTPSPELRAFYLAKDRCTRPANPDYINYGQRGIQFRFNSFEDFLAEVGRRPTTKHSIDRKDNDGHYEKGNVKWSTSAEQRRNSRSARLLTIQGQTLCLTDWAEKSPLHLSTVTNRLNRGMCNECSVFGSDELRICIHGRAQV